MSASARILFALTASVLAGAVCASPCHDQRIVINKVTTVAPYDDYEVVREVFFDVVTCEGTDADKLAHEGWRFQLAFQDIAPGNIRVLHAKRTGESGARPVVFVDAGPPRANGPSARVQTAVLQLTAAHPDWEYRYIQGDEKECLLSDAQTPATFAQTPAPLPVAPESLQEMAETFCGTTGRPMLVIAEQPPVWLTREATEWFLDPSRAAAYDEEARRTVGTLEQQRVHNGAAPRVLDRLFRTNRIVLATDATAPSSVLAARTLRAAESAGALVRLDALEKAHTFCGVPVAHSFRIRFDMSAVRKHPSGFQPFELQLLDAKNDVLLNAFHQLPDPTRHDYESAMLRALPSIMGGFSFVLVVLFAIINVSIGRRDERAFFVDSRNAAFAFAVATAAVALAILPNAETLAHQTAFRWAGWLCFWSVFLGSIFAITAAVQGSRKAT